MSDEHRNYGIEPEPGEPESGGARLRRVRTTAVSPRDERTWSILAHLTVFLNLVTGFLGPVGALVIWLMYRDQSPRISFHSLQSLWYQVAWMVILAVGWTVAAILTVVLIGFLLFPVMAILTVVPFVHMGYAAYKINAGVDYRYPFVADLIDGNRTAP
ncbi:MAG TPA: DUF4870 domain-containing protein [Rubrobacteraceae bacterium]|nr:DUF4870 domain-containing protein [Rubrobacteraceae bacterium]